MSQVRFVTHEPRCLLRAARDSGPILFERLSDSGAPGAKSVSPRRLHSPLHRDRTSGQFRAGQGHAAPLTETAAQHRRPKLLQVALYNPQALCADRRSSSNWSGAPPLFALRPPHNACQLPPLGSQRIQPLGVAKHFFSLLTYRRQGRPGRRRPLPSHYPRYLSQQCMPSSCYCTAGTLWVLGSGTLFHCVVAHREGALGSRHGPDPRRCSAPARSQATPLALQNLNVLAQLARHETNRDACCQASPHQ